MTSWHTALSVRPSEGPPGECPEVLCRLPRPLGSGGRTHWKISIRLDCIAQLKECSYDRLWKQLSL